MAEMKPKEEAQLKPAPEADAPKPAGTESPDGGQQPPQTEDQGFDKTLQMSKGTNVADEMREITGEDPNRRFKPLVDHVDREDETPEEKTDEPKKEEKKPDEKKPDESVSQPEPKKEDAPDGQKPAEEGIIEAGGRKFKSQEDLVKSYNEANREIHKTKFEEKQNRRKLELQVKALDNERKALEKLVLAGVNRDIEAGREHGKGTDVREQNGVTKRVSADEMNEALQGDNPAQAVERMMDDRLATIQDEQKKVLKQIRQEADTANEELMKGSIEANIQEARSSEDMKSFAENQDKFGAWLEKLYGNDDFGLDKINQICANTVSLKERYQTYLRDTYDFTTAIQQAKAEGEASASYKDKLAPVKSTTDSPKSDKKNKKRSLKPADKAYDAMENNLGMSRRAGSFITKEGFFR